VTVKTLIDVTKDFDYKMYKFQLKILRRTVYKIDKKYFTSTKSAILTLKTGRCIYVYEKRLSNTSKSF